MAPKTKLFVSARIFGEHSPQARKRKSDLGSSPGKDSFHGSKLDTAQQPHYQSCLFRREEYKKKGHNRKKMCWVRVAVKMLQLGNQAQKRTTPRRKLFRLGDYRNKWKQHQTPVLRLGPGEDGFHSSKLDTTERVKYEIKQDRRFTCRDFKPGTPEYGIRVVTGGYGVQDALPSWGFDQAKLTTRRLSRPFREPPAQAVLYICL